MRRLFKFFALWWITFYLIFVPPLAHAVSPAGWAMTAFNLPTSTITAVKNGLSVSVEVMPSASTVGGFAIRAAGSVAIAYAIAKYGGDAIDWVLDSANNQVRKKDDAVTGQCINFESGLTATSTSDALSKSKSWIKSKGAFWSPVQCSIPSGQSYIDCSDNAGHSFPFYNCAGGGQSISADEIGNDILNKAKAGDSAMANVVNGAMGDAVDKGDYDTALDKAAADNAAHNCGVGTNWNGSACVADPVKPVDPAKPLDLSSILSALQSIWNAIKDLANQIVEPIKTVINSVWDWLKSKYDWWANQWETFATGVKDFFTWFREEPEKPKDGDGSLPDVPIATDWQTRANDTYVNFGGSCPAPQIIPIQFMGASQNLTISYVPFCDFATKIRPAVILGAWIAGLMIITGGRTKE